MIHSYEVLRVVKFIETECTWSCPGPGGLPDIGTYLMGTEL